MRRDDELAEWANAHRRMFHDPDDSQTELLKKLLQRFPTLIDSDRQGPFADPWVLALALSLNSQPNENDPIEWVVVTEELPKGSGSTKIPDVCAVVDLEFINVLALFAERE